MKKTANVKSTKVMSGKTLNKAIHEANKVLSKSITDNKLSVNDKYGLSKMNVGDCVNVKEEDFKKVVSVTSSLSKNRTKVFTTNRSALTIRRVG